MDNQPTSDPKVQSRHLRTAASLSPASGGVIAARPRMGGKLGLNIHSRWGLPFSVDVKVWSHKSPCATGTLFGSDRPSPFVNGRVGTKVKDRITFHRPSDNPTTAAQESGAHGGRRQSRRLAAASPAALLSLKPPFCAGHHFAENQNAVRCSCV